MAGTVKIAGPPKSLGQQYGSILVGHSDGNRVAYKTVCRKCWCDPF